MGDDRREILARRARLVAAALAGVGLGVSAASCYRKTDAVADAGASDTATASASAQASAPATTASAPASASTGAADAGADAAADAGADGAADAGADASAPKPKPKPGSGIGEPPWKHGENPHACLGISPPKLPPSPEVCLYLK